MGTRLVLLGGPGSGKGTQAEPLCAQYGIPHISTGDMFRAAVDSDNPWGPKVKDCLDRGELVPDDVVLKVVRARLAQEDCATGFLLDGFPRSEPQAEALLGLLSRLGTTLDHALLIKVGTYTLLTRLTSRRVCKSCGAGYNTQFKPPRVEGVCDTCGGEVYQREDDREDTIHRRLEVYMRETEPVIEFYERAGLLRVINGERPIGDVTTSLVEVIGS